MVCTNATVIAAGAQRQRDHPDRPSRGRCGAERHHHGHDFRRASQSNNGNDSSTIVTSVCLATCPDIRVSKAGPASFTVGVNGTYTINVNNTLGGLATSAIYTVTDTLPAGMTIAVVPAGVGWTCTANTPVAGDNIVGGGRVVCTSVTVIRSVSGNPNAITVQVVASNAAVPSAVNNVSISGGGEPPGNTGNNSFQLTTPVNNFDLQVTKTGRRASTWVARGRTPSACATPASWRRREPTVTDPLPVGTISTVRPASAGPARRTRRSLATTSSAAGVVSPASR